MHQYFQLNTSYSQTKNKGPSTITRQIRHDIPILCTWIVMFRDRVWCQRHVLKVWDKSGRLARNGMCCWADCFREARTGFRRFEDGNLFELNLETGNKKQALDRLRFRGSHQALFNWGLSKGIRLERDTMAEESQWPALILPGFIARESRGKGKE